MATFSGPGIDRIGESIVQEEKAIYDEHEDKVSGFSFQLDQLLLLLTKDESRDASPEVHVSDFPKPTIEPTQVLVDQLCYVEQILRSISKSADSLIWEPMQYICLMARSSLSELAVGLPP